MSAVMLAAGWLVGRQPPEAIARFAVQAATGEQPTEPVADLLSSLAHLGFGAAVGAGYVLLPRSGPPLLRGMGMALAVNVVSDQGWVPALGILPPALTWSRSISLTQWPMSKDFDCNTNPHIQSAVIAQLAAFAWAWLRSLDTRRPSQRHDPPGSRRLRPTSQDPGTSSCVPRERLA